MDGVGHVHEGYRQAVLRTAMWFLLVATLSLLIPLEASTDLRFVSDGPEGDALLWVVDGDPWQRLEHGDVAHATLGPGIHRVDVQGRDDAAWRGLVRPEGAGHQSGWFVEHVPATASDGSPGTFSRWLWGIPLTVLVGGLAGVLGVHKAIQAVRFRYIQ